MKKLLLLLLLLFLISCNDKKIETYWYKIYREDSPNNFTMWNTTQKPTMDGSFLCWTTEDGGSICISGKITIKSIKISEGVKTEKVKNEE